MQFALQDLRKWGYRKIFMSFVPNDNSRDFFFHNIEVADCSYYSIRCSSFSFPRKWGTIRDNIKFNYIGMNSFIHLCEPMIDTVDIDTACQRKFRNHWQSLWKTVARDLSLTDREYSLLERFGIRLAFEDDTLYEVPFKITQFFNVILCWYVLTQTESSFTRLGMTALELIELMITSDDDDFVDLIVDNFL